MASFKEVSKRHRMVAMARRILNREANASGGPSGREARVNSTLIRTAGKIVMEAAGSETSFRL
jgi:hypothetical protein